MEDVYTFVCMTDPAHAQESSRTTSPELVSYHPFFHFRRRKSSNLRKFVILSIYVSDGFAVERVARLEAVRI